MECLTAEAGYLTTGLHNFQVSVSPQLSPTVYPNLPIQLLPSDPVIPVTQLNAVCVAVPAGPHNCTDKQDCPSPIAAWSPSTKETEGKGS